MEFFKVIAFFLFFHLGSACTCSGNHCDMFAQCSDDFRDTIISFVILIVVFVVVFAYSVRALARKAPTLVDDMVKKKVRNYSIISFILLSLTSVGFFVVLWIPTFYWVAIPSLVGIMMCLFCVGTIQKNGAFAWMIAAMAHLAWTVIWLIICWIVLIARGLSEARDDDAPNYSVTPEGDRNFSLLMGMAWLNMVLVGIGSCVACCLNSAVKNMEWRELSEEKARQAAAVPPPNGEHIIVAIPAPGGDPGYAMPVQPAYPLTTTGGVPVAYPAYPQPVAFHTAGVYMPEGGQVHMAAGAAYGQSGYAPLHQAYPLESSNNDSYQPPIPRPSAPHA